MTRAFSSRRDLYEERTVSLFFLWNLCLLFEHFIYPFWFPTPLGQLHLLTLIFAFGFPRSVPAFAAQTAISLLNILAWAPAGSSSHHTVLGLFIDIAFLIAIVLYYMERRRTADAFAGIYLKMAPVLRLILIGTYVFGFFAKLNTDFLNPRYSCALAVLKSYSQLYPDLSWLFQFPGRDILAIWGPLISEGALGLLFIFRKTRSLALVWGILFHFVLAIMLPRDVFAFSAFMLFLLFTFLPDGAFMAAHARLRKAAAWAGGLPRQPLRRIILAALSVYLLPMANALWVHRSPPFLLVWLLVYPLISAAFLYGLGADKAAFSDPLESRPFRPKNAALWIPFLLFIVNGTAPYIGLKTQYCLNMYSNLTIFGEKPNHLLWPSSWIVFKQDMVRVLASSDMNFIRFGGGRRLMTVFEFRRRINRDPPGTWVGCVYKNQLVIVRLNSENKMTEPLTERLPLWQQTLLHFRTECAGKHNTFCGW